MAAPGTRLQLRRDGAWWDVALVERTFLPRPVGPGAERGSAAALPPPGGVGETSSNLAQDDGAAQVAGGGSMAEAPAAMLESGETGRAVCHVPPPPPPGDAPGASVQLCHRYCVASLDHEDIGGEVEASELRPAWRWAEQRWTQAAAAPVEDVIGALARHQA